MEGKDQHALRMHGDYALMQKDKEVIAIICRKQYVIMKLSLKSQNVFQSVPAKSCTCDCCCL